MCSLCLARHLIFICSRTIQSKTPVNLHWAALPFIQTLLYSGTLFCVFCTYFLFGLQNEKVWISWLVGKYNFSGWLIVMLILMCQVLCLSCYVAQAYTAAQLSDQSEQQHGLLLKYCKCERVVVELFFLLAWQLAF